MNRTDLLKHLIARFGYRSYLEIGCDRDDNWRQIVCPTKVGVDPERGGNWRGTSDAFFAQNTARFDLIFLDGLHTSAQTYCDLAHALDCLSVDGCIVLHDCLPQTAVQQTENDPGGDVAWCGGVWKVLAAARATPGLGVRVGMFDWGCGVIFVGRGFEHLAPLVDLGWDDYLADWPKGAALGICFEPELLAWIERHASRRLAAPFALAEAR